MNAGRIGGKRVARINDRGQFGDLDFDLVRDVFRRRGGWGKNGGNGFTDKAHDILGQDWLLDRLIIELVQHRPDRPHAFEVRRSNDLCFVWRGDADDAAGGDRTADEAHIVRGGKIGREPATPGHQRRVFQPPDGAADPLHSGASSGGFHVSALFRIAAARRHRPG
jgi:hypothetical protein